MGARKHAGRMALRKMFAGLLARLGWRQRQHGGGTQIGLVQGNVTIQQPQLPSAPVLPPRSESPPVQDVLMVLDALPTAKRELVEGFARTRFRTTFVKSMTDGQRAIYYKYAYTTLERVRRWQM